MVSFKNFYVEGSLGDFAKKDRDILRATPKSKPEMPIMSLSLNGWVFFTNKPTLKLPFNKNEGLTPTCIRIVDFFKSFAENLVFDWIYRPTKRMQYLTGKLYGIPFVLVTTDEGKMIIYINREHYNLKDFENRFDRWLQTQYEKNRINPKEFTKQPPKEY